MIGFLFFFDIFLASEKYVRGLVFFFEKKRTFDRVLREFLLVEARVSCYA